MKSFLYHIVTLFFFTTNVFFAQEIMSLEDCVNYALEHNIAMQKEYLNTQIEDQNIKITRSNLLPTINSAVTQSTTIHFSNYSQFIAPRLNNFSTNLEPIQLNYTFYNGLINKNSLKKAALNKEISISELKKLENNITILITNAYLEYLVANEFVKISKNQLSLSTEQLDIVKKRVKSGTIAEAEVFNAEATLAQDEETVLKQENRKKIALLELKKIMQMPVNQKLEINSEFIQRDLLYNDAEEYYTKAVQLRPEIKTAELVVESSKVDMSISKGRFLPTASLNYSLNSLIANTNSFPDVNYTSQIGSNFKNFASLRVSMPIFNGKRNKSRYKISKFNNAVSKLDLEAVKYSLRQEVEQMFVDLKNTEQALASSEKTFNARKIALEYSQKRFNVGKINNFEYDKVKNDFIQAQANFTQAKYSYMFKVKVFHYYTLGVD